MSEIVAVLKSLDLRNQTEDIIREAVRKINYCVSPAYKCPAGLSIYRSVLCNKHFFPDTKGKVSFNPKPIKYNRANIPGKPIFYGSITTQRTDEDLKRMGLIAESSIMKENPGYMINILECSDLATTYEAEGTELFAIGMWRILKDFEVSTVVNHEPINDFSINEYEFLTNFYSDIERNNNVQDFDESFVNIIRNVLPEYKLINKYIAEEFGKSVSQYEEFKYQISANYSNNLIYHPKIDVLGIKYPSVKANKEGFNLALHPNVVEQDFIELERTALVRIFKKKDSNEIVWNWEGMAEFNEGEPFNYIPIKDVTIPDELLILKLREKNIEHLFVPSRS